MMPTADHVARAIVAACKETGDDPIRTIQGGLGGTSRPINRARHYAMHALLHVFQDLPRHTAARIVGSGSPVKFWNTSWHQIAKPRGGGLGHVAGWFDDEAYARVITAIQLDPVARRLSADVVGMLPSKRRLYDDLAQAVR